jgi:hypothetical protein
MLKGFADFVRETDLKACLVMMEYGNDWPAAKKMAEELGIKEQVHWIPKCGRKEIFPLLKYFDAGFGTLSYPHWSYNVVMELISARVPVIKRESVLSPGSEPIYPYLAANSAAEVTAVLQRIKAKIIDTQSLTQQAYDWHKQRIARFLKGLDQSLKDIAAKKKHTFGSFAARATWVYYAWLLQGLSAIKFKLGIRNA